MKVVLAGGTGFVGNTLIEHFLKQKCELFLFTRNGEKAEQKWGEALRVLVWDAKSVDVWADAVNGVDAVINLAGEPIAAKRWTQAQKQKILDSRVESTKAIVDAILRAKIKPKTYINASAVGFYGSVLEGQVTEDTSKGSGFLADTCERWEQEAGRADGHGVRVVKLRIGVVLEKNGGALKKMIPPFLLFMGGPLGSGKQWMPWIHRDDLIGVIDFALQNEQLCGAVNATAMEPVTMKNFCAELGRVLKRPSWAPVPGFLLKLLLGEMSEMLLTGQCAVPDKLSQAGYTFKYPRLSEALRAIFHSGH